MFLLLLSFHKQTDPFCQYQKNYQCHHPAFCLKKQNSISHYRYTPFDDSLDLLFFHRACILNFIAVPFCKPRLPVLCNPYHPVGDRTFLLPYPVCDHILWSDPGKGYFSHINHSAFWNFRFHTFGNHRITLHS